MASARGEVSITLGGVERKLTPSFKAIIALEEKTGEPLLDFIQRMGGKKFAARDVVAIVWAGLVGSGMEVTMEEAGDLVYQEGVMNVIKPLTDFISQLCTGGKQVEAPK